MSPDGIPAVRIYGPCIDHGSWARVAAGMRQGLASIGRLAGFSSLEETVRDMDDGLEDGYDAPVGVLVGPPSFCSILRGRGSHSERAVMVAANSSWLPSIQALEEFATLVLAPSAWSASVIEGHTRLPVMVWRHGVSEAFRPDVTSYVHTKSCSDGRYAVLHMASTIKQRKSTEQLVRAWGRMHRDGVFESPDEATLQVVLSGPHGDLLAALREEVGDDARALGSIDFWSRLNLDEQAMAVLYQSYDLVCQPSRAEGFGLVPLEARACGVPVCATDCTGHAEHMHDGGGVIHVDWGDEEPIDDGPGALAPAVSVDDVQRALVRCYEARHSLPTEALATSGDLRHNWSWEAVCRAWADEYF